MLWPAGRRRLAGNGLASRHAEQQQALVERRSGSAKTERPPRQSANPEARRETARSCPVKSKFLHSVNRCPKRRSASGSSSGRAVGLDEPIASLETDKVSIEVTAPVAGVLGENWQGAGDTVLVGAVIASDR